MPYKPITILSDNRKTGCSIDLPIQGHCTPTKNCLHDCYAKSGPQALPCSQRKHLYVSTYLKRKNIRELIIECKRKTNVRLNGSGDLLPAHIPQILKLAQSCPETIFWGMTRKTNIALALNGRIPNLHLLLSVDSSSPEAVWNYPGKMCYGPRRYEDTVPDDPRIVTVFPRHFAGRIIKNVPVHKKDCPAVRHIVTGCAYCKRCWKG
jgi:hypothetical protein